MFDVRQLWFLQLLALYMSAFFSSQVCAAAYVVKLPKPSLSQEAPESASVFWAGILSWYLQSTTRQCQPQITYKHDPGTP